MLSTNKLKDRNITKMICIFRIGMHTVGMNTLERNTVIAALQNGLCRVQFIKADGTERVMIATLAASYLPQTTGGTLTRSPDLIVCFDTGTNAWRSFYLPRVIEFTPLSKAA